MNHRFGNPEGARELASEAFHASWRSGLAYATIFMALIVTGLAFGAVTARTDMRWALGAGALVVAWLTWWLGRPLWDGEPIVRFGSRGITGRRPKAVAIPWSDVADLRVEVIQGNAQLVVVRRPQPGQQAKRTWWGGSGLETRIALAGLHARKQPDVVGAAQRHFAARAGQQAEAAAQEQVAQALAHERFDAKLIALTPRVWAMPLVMAACVLVWVANVASGMSWMQPRADELFRWGANSASAVQAGQWWRLVSAMFLHGGVIHLALNMYALWEAGLMVTRLFGNRGFLVAYFGAGLAGNALSLYFSGQTGVSVGASGAVFGVAGALLAAVFQHGGKFPSGRSTQLMTSLGIFIAYSLIYGFSRQGIDNAAHVGGLLAGFAAGWLMVEKIDENATPSRLWGAAAGTAALCAAATAAMVWFVPPAKRDVAAYFADMQRWDVLQADVRKTLEAVRNDTGRNKAGQLDDAALAQRLQTVHAPAMRRAESGLAGLRLPADEMTGRYAAAQKRYAGAMAALMEAEVRRVTAPTPELAQELQRLAGEARQANEAIGALNAEAAARKGRD
jgi:rhomboid protease GluP